METPNGFFLTEAGQESHRPRRPPRRLSSLTPPAPPPPKPEHVTYTPAKSANISKRGDPPLRKTSTTTRPRQLPVPSTGSDVKPPRNPAGRRFCNTVTAMISMRQDSRKFGKKARKSPVKLQNTYKLETKEDEKFLPDRVEKAMTDILSAHLDGMTYDPAKVKDLVPRLSNLIKTRVKALKFDRHRIVCNLTIGQNMGQGVEYASRCLWDDSRDSWACASYSNETIYAIATVHGIFFE